MMSVVVDEQLSLVREASGGDRHAFSTLVSLHWPWMVHLARSIVADQNAEDLVQQAIVLAWKRLPSLSKSAALSSWLAGILVNVALKRVEDGRRAEAPDGADDYDADLDGDPEVVLSSDLDVQAVLRLLSPRQRAILHLGTVEGKTDTEIAGILALAPSSVRVHRARARQRLESVLQGSISSDEPSSELPEFDHEWGEWLDAPFATSQTELRDRLPLYLPRRRRWARMSLAAAAILVLAWIGADVARRYQQAGGPSSSRDSVPTSFAHQVDDNVILFMTEGDVPLYVVLNHEYEEKGAAP